MKNLSIIMRNIILPVSCVVFLLLLSCSSHEQPGKLINSVGQIKDLKISDVSLNSFKWTLFSNLTTISENEDKMHFLKPKLKFFRQNKIVSVITSDIGNLDMKNKNTQLIGNVVVISKDKGTVLKTQKLKYDSSINKILTEEKVLIYDKNTIIKAEEFKANPDLTEIELKDHETVIK